MVSTSQPWVILTVYAKADKEKNMKIYVFIPQGMNLPDGATKSCGMESEKGLSDMNRLGFAWLGVRAHVH